MRRLLTDWRCRVFGHKVSKARRFFLTERRARCQRCGKRVQLHHD